MDDAWGYGFVDGNATNVVNRPGVPPVPPGGAVVDDITVVLVYLKPA